MTKLREGGIDVADGGAIDEASVELWRGVDRAKVEVLACGANGQRFRMDVGLTEQVPFLRSPRGGDFTFSRPGTSAHDKLVAQFGPNLGSVSLAFSKRDVEKWARSPVEEATKAERFRRRQTANWTAKPPSASDAGDPQAA